MVYCKKFVTIILAVALIGSILILCSTQAFAGDAALMAQDDEHYEENGELTPLEDEFVISEEITGEDELPLTRAISLHDVYFQRTTATKATARITATGTASVKTMKSTVSLQRKNTKGVYVTVSGTTKSKTLSKKTVTHTVQYGIAVDKKYRVKSVVSDGTTSHTLYRMLK